MQTAVDPRAFHVAAYLPPLPTGADEHEPDATDGLDFEAGIVSPPDSTLDADDVEHVRQSRLQRWQRQER